MFSRNVSTSDRDLRFLAGAFVVYLAVFVVPGVYSFLVGGIALVLFVTAIAGFCPLYRLIGVDTYAAARRRGKE